MVQPPTLGELAFIAAQPALSALLDRALAAMTRRQLSDLETLRDEIKFYYGLGNSIELPAWKWGESQPKIKQALGATGWAHELIEWDVVSLRRQTLPMPDNQATPEAAHSAEQSDTKTAEPGPAA